MLKRIFFAKILNLTKQVATILRAREESISRAAAAFGARGAHQHLRYFSNTINSTKQLILHLALILFNEMISNDNQI